MLTAIDREVLPIDTGLQGAVHCFQKVVAMRLDVESDQVRSEHAVEQLALPGTDGERLGIGPGNVPENRHTRVGTPFLDHARQEGKVIILHEHGGARFTFHLVEESVGEFPVHGLVVLPIPGAERRAGMGNVAQRPEALIGETEIKTFLLFGG